MRFPKQSSTGHAAGILGQYRSGGHLYKYKKYFLINQQIAAQSKALHSPVTMMILRLERQVVITRPMASTNSGGAVRLLPSCSRRVYLVIDCSSVPITFLDTSRRTLRPADFRTAMHASAKHGTLKAEAKLMSEWAMRGLLRLHASVFIFYLRTCLT